MPLERRGDAAVVDHAYARHVLTDLRSASTEQIEFRRGLVRLGRICGYELIDGRFDTQSVRVQTPLAETEGEQIAGLDDVVIVNVLRAATPFVEGLLDVFPAARQGVVSASRDEDAGMTAGAFPVSHDYVKLPDLRPGDNVIVADPMLATGSTMSGVLADLTQDGPEPEQLIALSAVATQEGIDRITDGFPDVEVVTVSVDDGLDEDGFILPGLGDAGDRAFGTKQ